MSAELTLSARVAAAIRRELGGQDLNKAELARRLGVSHTWVTNRLTCHQEIGLNDLERIAAALDVQVTALMPSPANSSSPNVRSRTTVRSADRRIGRTRPQLDQPPQRTQLPGQPPERVPGSRKGRPQRISTPAQDGGR